MKGTERVWKSLIKVSEEDPTAERSTQENLEPDRADKSRGVPPDPSKRGVACSGRRSRTPVAAGDGDTRGRQVGRPDTQMEMERIEINPKELGESPS